MNIHYVKYNQNEELSVGRLKGNLGPESLLLVGEDLFTSLTVKGEGQG